MILNFFSSPFMDDFEKRYCAKIKNKNLYFWGLILYGLFPSLIILVLLTGGGILIEIYNPIVFNYSVLIIIVSFLYCFKKAFLMIDKYNKTHWL